MSPSSIGSMLSWVIVHPVLLIVLAGLLIYIWTYNYRRFVFQRTVTDYAADEEPLDAIAVNSWPVRTETVLTNQRVFQSRLNWFFSRRKVYTIALKDVHSVVWRRHMNWILVLLAFMLMSWISSLALLLFLFAVESRINRLLFDTPFALMPRTRISIFSSYRQHIPQFLQFFNKAQQAWAEIRKKQGLPAAVMTRSSIAEETDFLWGRTVWASVLFLLLCGLLQRLAEKHISYDDYVFFPIYVGLPAAVAIRSLRDGVWVTIVGFLAVFTMKFTGVVASERVPPNFDEYVGVFAAVLLIVLAARFLATRVHPALAGAAAVLWLLFVPLRSAPLFYDVALYGKVFLAGLAIVLFTWLDRLAYPEYLVQRGVA